MRISHFPAVPLSLSHTPLPSHLCCSSLSAGLNSGEQKLMKLTHTELMVPHRSRSCSLLQHSNNPTRSPREGTQTLHWVRAGRRQATPKTPCFTPSSPKQRLFSKCLLLDSFSCSFFFQPQTITQHVQPFFPPPRSLARPASLFLLPLCIDFAISAVPVATG